MWFSGFFFLILSLIVEVYLWWKLQASLIFLSGRTCTIGGWLNTVLPHCIYIYQNLFKKGALDTSWHLYHDASFLKQLVNSHLTYLYQKNQQVKPVGAHIIWGYKCFANGPGADLLLFDCIKYGKYYSAIFCLLEVAFKIHLAQKTSLSMGMTPLGTAIIKPERKAAWLW